MAAGRRISPSTTRPSADHSTRLARTPPPDTVTTARPAAVVAAAGSPRSHCRPITFERLTGMVSSSSTTVTVSADTPVIAHSTNSWFSAVPTTTRSFSVPSGIAPCHGDSAPTAATSGSHAIDRTRAAGSSIRPSGRMSTAGCVPSHAKSSPDSVEPSTSVSTSLGRPSEPAGCSAVRRTARTRSPASATSSPRPPAWLTRWTPAASIRVSRPAVRLPSPCSTSTANGATGGMSAARTAAITGQSDTTNQKSVIDRMVSTTASPRQTPAV